MLCKIDQHQEAIDLVCLDNNCQTKGKSFQIYLS